MRLYLRTVAIAALLGLVLTGVRAGAAELERGEALAETCRGCHGIEGYKNTYPTYKVPRLVGQNADYIVLALKAYRSGERSHPTMQSQAASMTDEDMAAIAAYIASLGEGAE